MNRHLMLDKPRPGRLIMRSEGIPLIENNNSFKMQGVSGDAIAKLGGLYA